MNRMRAGVAVGAVAAAATTALTLVVPALLRRQAAIARRRIGKPLGETALDADRVWGSASEGERIDLLLLGDSIAAGLGAEKRKQTLGARLAKGVAEATGRPVRLRTAAVVGSESAVLAEQLAGLPRAYHADVAVIVVGGNDVTHRVPVIESATFLRAALTILQVRGIPAVVGTCPDLGSLRAVPQPLRALASRASRTLAAAQAATAEAAGARVVRLGAVVGPVFSEQPDVMFSVDRFHPSAAGYRRTADALLPEVLAALEDGTTPEVDLPEIAGPDPDPDPPVVDAEESERVG